MAAAKDYGQAIASRDGKAVQKVNRSVKRAAAAGHRAEAEARDQETWKASRSCRPTRSCRSSLPEKPLRFRRARAQPSSSRAWSVAFVELYELRQKLKARNVDTSSIASMTAGTLVMSPDDLNARLSQL
eukprot:TRINITY_DN23097_c0_g1_i1.p1 TRINITY_DN23097_c0_g1~~TRINITY_DN23097_c0_g1_i1.p1  ORF type:complete len:129 (+),score=27.04 TRINITY_DN23097_c0_g1_i1:253-639(+)